MAEPLHDANDTALPRSVETYHDQTTVLVHNKKVRKQKNEIIKQQFGFKIQIADGRMYLWIQKDGQRRLKATRESEMNALTAKVIENVLVWMGFPGNKMAKMTKPQLVEFICAVFQIPTKKTLNIDVEDTAAIIQYLIQKHDEEAIVLDLIYYTENHWTSLGKIADIIELCEEQQIDVRSYLSPLWIGFLNNFQLNNNDDDAYRKGFDAFVETDEIIGLQTTLANSVERILRQYCADNKVPVTIQLYTFWYSCQLLLFRYFNYCAKQCVLEKYVRQPASDEEKMSEALECTVSKFFGSAFCGCQKTYKSKNYGAAKREVLLAICDKCLVNYDTDDFEATQNGSNTECKNEEYMKVNLRLRLQNRGYMSLIKHSFFKDIGTHVYLTISQDIKRVFVSYDPKKIKAIEESIINTLYDKFDKYIGPLSIVSKENDESYYKKKVWKDLIHRVTSRLVVSLKKRNKCQDNRIGFIRTAVKATLSNKS
eukprot:489593_1